MDSSTGKGPHTSTTPAGQTHPSEVSPSPQTANLSVGVSENNHRWDEKCIITLTQHRHGRLNRVQPHASMRCIQRLLDGHAGKDKTVLYKHSNDFVAVLNEAIAMMDPQSLEDLNGNGPDVTSNSAASLSESIASVDANSKSTSNVSEINSTITHNSHYSSSPPANYSPSSSSSTPLAATLSSRITTEYMNPTVTYLTRIYTPYFNFLQSYKDGVQSGAALSILGRYWDAVVVEQRPWVIGTAIAGRWRGWVSQYTGGKEGSGKEK
ncbi:hypothetical protein HDU81_003635 [Chytriomyces hyalinus]|nr:hypothetical protein HDU81_003635 [Chytriomyces hyalinus]